MMSVTALTTESAVTPAIIAVGSSLGGLHALRALLGALPRDFPCPIVVAQHRVSEAGEGLVDVLRASISLDVVDAEDKITLVPARVYLAPADYHLMVDDGRCSLSIDAPVCHARPSIDVLFESVADAYGAAAVGVVLTGSSGDGAAGLRRLRARGGRAVIQHPATAESPGMPAAALVDTPDAEVLPLAAIAAWLTTVTAHTPTR